MPRMVSLLIIAGFLLGLVLYGWQVSLLSFNGTVKLEKPVVLWSVTREQGNTVELEVLGKKWLRFPSLQGE